MANTERFASTYDDSKPPTSQVARPDPPAMTNPPVGTFPDPTRMANRSVSISPKPAGLANHRRPGCRESTESVKSRPFLVRRAAIPGGNAAAGLLLAPKLTRLRSWVATLTRAWEISRKTNALGEHGYPEIDAVVIKTNC